MLYLHARDFSSLLSTWNSSGQKKQWLKSANYEVFSRSRLFIRLKEAGDQFAAVAGLSPDMNFLTQTAGKESVLALYDIGNLQFLAITRLPSANSLQNALWQSRGKFETRNAGGIDFYLRRNPESGREVEFAIAGDKLLLATREDLMAGALRLISGSKDRTIEDETWYSQATAATAQAGDLRMVLNMTKIVPSSYFRTYWVQQNITDMKKYAAAVSDIFLSGSEFREERVLFEKATDSESASPDDTGQDVADLVRLVPDEAGFYQAEANPSAKSCLDLIVSKILAPHGGPMQAGKYAPLAPTAGERAGHASDLETRIDQPVRAAGTTDGSAALKQLLSENVVRAALRIQKTEKARDGVFVRIHSAVAFEAEKDWNEAAVQSALADFARPMLTTNQMGIGWQQEDGSKRLDGLFALEMAVRGKILMVSDDSQLISQMQARFNRAVNQKPATFVAGFNHQRERENFVRLTSLIDRPSVGLQRNAANRQPQLFSENLASLSATLGGVISEKIVIRDAGNKEFQTVTYKWAE